MKKQIIIWVSLILISSSVAVVSVAPYDSLNVNATPGGIPVVVTENATGVQETNATLWGRLIDDAGVVCQYRFQYDLDSGVPYAMQTGWAGAVHAGETFSENVTGLLRGEVYYFRAEARNVNGTNAGAERLFLTKPGGPQDFQAVVYGGAVILSWIKGTGAERTVIVRKQGSYPVDRTDGAVVYNGTGVMTIDEDVTYGNWYYYVAWGYVSREGLAQYSDDTGRDRVFFLEPTEFDIRNIVVHDNIIPDLVISVIVENKGAYTTDITVNWWLMKTDAVSVLDAGSDTFQVEAFSQKLYFIYPSTMFIGRVMIVFEGYNASASKMFTTSPFKTGAWVPVPPPVPPPEPPPVVPSPVVDMVSLLFMILLMAVVFALVTVFLLLFLVGKRRKRRKAKTYKYH